MSQTVSQTHQASTEVSTLLQRLGEAKIIGIVRTDSEESALWVSRVLIEAGIQWLEVTFTVPNAPNVMEQLSEQFPHAVIGAGTVLDGKQAVQALAAGAQFLVSPVTQEPMIQFGLANDLLVMPGCLTPTEIFHAWTLGAPAIKFFPAQPVGGPEYLSAVRGPFPQIPLVATGGIGLPHVAGYIKAGALAVGVGSPLMPSKDIKDRNSGNIRALATAYREALGLTAAP